MNSLEHFNIFKTHAEYRPIAQVSLAEGVALVESAILFARNQQIQRLLIDIRGLTGFEPPDLTARYFIARKWAATADGKIRAAMVANTDIIDPDRFGVRVALNRGFIADIFNSDTDALSWLLGQ